MSEGKKAYGRAQTIFRVAKNADNPFVMMDRRPLENESLSWGAKGLLGYLLSRPDDWVVRFKDLANRSTDGAYRVRGYLKELRGAGHVQVITHRDGGRIVEWEYKVLEVPPDGDFQEVEKQQVENRTFNKNKRSLTKRTIKGATPQPATHQPATPKASELPHTKLYREVTKKYPPESVWEVVEGHMANIQKRLGRYPTLDDLKPYYQAWVSNGWNQFSVNWLEYAVRGALPGTKKAGMVDTLPKAFDAVKSWLEGTVEGEVVNG